MTFSVKLVASHVGLVLAVILLSMGLLNWSFGGDLERDVDERLEAQALGAARWIGEGGYARNHQLAERIAAIVQAEVTILDREGRVLADSSGQPFGPVLRSWPEIIEARRGHVGRAIRPVPGKQERYHHVAVATEEGFILRLSSPQSRIQAAVEGMRRRLRAAGAIALVAAALLAILASRLTARPLRSMTRAAARIASGDYDTRLNVGADDDIGRLARALNEMAADLRERNTMRRDYLANLSHELRTPVAAIVGYAESLLEKRADPQKERSFLETINRQAGRLAALVEEVLLLTELEARPIGKTNLEAVDVLALARGVRDTVRNQAEREGIEILVADVGAVEVLADPDGLEIVLQNLIDNAIRHGQGLGRVWVSAERAGDWVSVVVADDGPGIAAEHLPRIFERFYRVDPARSRERGGAGLGLSIVKSQLELMGGKVRAESEPGNGCRFICQLRSAAAGQGNAPLGE